MATTLVVKTALAAAETLTTVKALTEQIIKVHLEPTNEQTGEP